MDTRLLRHYESELAYMRDMGAEFAHAYPKIAARLGMEGLEVLDPYVERLLEGFAFLSARVQLELELQYPGFTSNLLEIVYPHYLAPLPVDDDRAFRARYRQRRGQGGLCPQAPHPASGPAGRGRADRLHLPHRAMDVTLWPLEIAEAEYIDSRGGLVAAGVSRNTEARAGIRLRLKRTDGGKMADLPMDRLTLHLTGQGGQAWGAARADRRRRRRPRRPRPPTAAPTGRCNCRSGESCSVASRPTRRCCRRPARASTATGCCRNISPCPSGSTSWISVGLRPGLQEAPGSDVDIYILLKEGNKSLGDGMTKDAFMLHAVPAVNLFPRRFDRVHITDRRCRAACGGQPHRADGLRGLSASTASSASPARARKT